MLIDLLAAAAVLALAACRTNTTEPQALDLNIYNLPVRAVAAAPEGYVVLSDSSWFTVDAFGQAAPPQPLPFNANEEFYASDVLCDNNSVYVLAAVYSKEGWFVDLEVLHYGMSGELIKRNRVRIADGFDKEFLKYGNPNYSVSNPLYAKGVLEPSSDLLVAFNYIGKPGKRYKYALLRLDKGLNLLNRIDKETHDAYAWIYALKQLHNGQFVMTRGGNDWFAVDQFDLSLEVRSDVKMLPIDKGSGNPVLTNILQLSGEEIVLTGHIDGRNNPDNSLVTNYDNWVVLYNLQSGLKKEFKIESADSSSRYFKELCFDSYLTNSNRLVLAGSQRGYNQTTLDLSAKARIVETDLEGKVQKEFIVTQAGGMEALFINDRDSREAKDIIGRKFGFGKEPVQTFFKTITTLKNE